MRILYLSPSAALGGAERAMLEVFHALRTFEPAWTLGLLAFEHGPVVTGAEARGVETMVLPMPPTLSATGEYGRAAWSTVLDLTRGAAGTLKYVTEMRRAIAGWHADIVHSNGIKAHVIAPWVHGRARLVWHLHDYLSTRRVSGRLLRASAGAADVVLANSTSVAADVSEVLGPRRRVQTVYNAVDLSRFHPGGPRLDLDAAAGMTPAVDVVRIGLVATFARWKGHEVFLNALAELPDTRRVRAYIVGGPLYRTGDLSQTTLDELRDLRRRLGLEDVVGFTGFLDDPASAYRSLDIVVHASTRPEPFGLCIAEAMAAGRAVVISDAGGAREVAEPGKTCLTHSPGDARSLADGLSQLVSDRELRDRLGRAAFEHARARFSHEALARSLAAVYRGLTQERAA